MTGHTPGPWETELVADRVSDWFEIRALMGEKSGSVADTSNRACTIDPDEDRANARLIAAAPDLLHALENLCVHCEVDLNPQTETAWIRDSVARARKVIAKATEP